MTKVGVPWKGRSILCKLRVVQDEHKLKAELVAKTFSSPAWSEKRRRLSIYEELGKGKLKYDKQEKSLFFRLPAELRLQIYQDILGGWTILLLHETRPARLCSVKRRLSKPDYDGDDQMLPLRRTPDLANEGKRDLLLPLLQTCRRIYTEAIPLLYTDNVFDIRQPQSFNQLPQSILPQRLQSIRALEIHWFLLWACRNRSLSFDDAANWNDMWARISRMQGLQRVLVKLYSLEHVIEPGRVLQPLTCVRQVRDFRVKQFTEKAAWFGGRLTAVLAPLLENSPFVFEELLVHKAIPGKNAHVWSSRIISRRKLEGQWRSIVLS